MSTPKDSLQIQRGKYGFGATAIFVGLRLLDPLVQYYVLKSNPLTRFLNHNLKMSIPPPPTGGSTIKTFSLNLSPFQSTIWAMSAITFLKHAFWALFIRREPMTVPFALFAGISDLLFLTLHTLVFTFASSNPLFSPHLVYAGFVIHTSFITLEAVSEIQRQSFKSKPKNKGKPYTDGLFGLARHVNYGCEVIMAFGHGLAAGGPLWACMASGVYVLNFVYNAIPSIEQYCHSKYRGKWVEYEKKVPWLLFTGIY